MRGFTCVPCADVCNNHATECDGETRVCVCLNNTVGDQCDVCAPGFFGDATVGSPTDCQECECDLVGSVNGSVCHPINGTCECKVGLVSPCRVCAEGFFNKTNDGCQRTFTPDILYSRHFCYLFSSAKFACATPWARSMRVATKWDNVRVRTV